MRFFIKVIAAAFLFVIVAAGPAAAGEGDTGFGWDSPPPAPTAGR